MKYLKRRDLYNRWTTAEEPKNILIVLAANFIVLAGAVYFFLSWLVGNGIIETARDFSEATKIAGNSAPLVTSAATPLQEAVTSTSPLPISFETMVVWIAGIIILSALFGFFIARATRKK